MKKYLFMLVLFICVYFTLTEIDSASVKIPAEAIRLRVIPNSNSVYDQEIKRKIKKILEDNTYPLIESASTINDAREIIAKNLDSISLKIEQKLQEKNYDKGYKINFGTNYFPEKEFKGIKYDKGNYESLVVTLGEGLGDNWWCVLFPPLCLLEAEENETDDTEYTFFVKELIDKYFS